MKRFTIPALIVIALAFTSCSSGWKCTKHYGSAERHKIEKKVRKPYP